MINNYILTNEADSDLSDIFDYTENEFGYNQAVKYLSNLKTALSKISKNPAIGRKRKDLKKGIFSVPEQSHVIFYLINKEVLIIVRVLHSSRDLKNFM